jgi:hypothetical protein
MKWLRFASLLMFSLVACRREQPPPAPAVVRHPRPTVTRPQDMSKAKVNQVIAPDREFLDHCLLGSETAPDGSVTAQKSEFAAGDPVKLTIWLKESPEGLQMSAQWWQGSEKIAEERRAMKGGKVVTFELKKKLKPGKYRVEGMWGGNTACDMQFEVAKKKR